MVGPQLREAGSSNTRRQAPQEGRQMRGPWGPEPGRICGRSPCVSEDWGQGPSLRAQDALTHWAETRSRPNLPRKEFAFRGTACGGDCPHPDLGSSLGVLGPATRPGPATDADTGRTALRTEEEEINKILTHTGLLPRQGAHCSGRQRGTSAGSAGAARLPAQQSAGHLPVLSLPEEDLENAL